MSRTIRLAVVLMLVVPTVSSVGCNKKDEGKPNSELTVPDIPRSSSADGKKGPTGGAKLK